MTSPFDRTDNSIIDLRDLPLSFETSGEGMFEALDVELDEMMVEVLRERLAGLNLQTGRSAQPGR